MGESAGPRDNRLAGLKAAEEQLDEGSGYGRTHNPSPGGPSGSSTHTFKKKFCTATGLTPYKTSER